MRCHPKDPRAQRPGGPGQPDLAVCTPPPTPRRSFPTCLSELSGRVRARAVPEYTLRDRLGAVAVRWAPRSVRDVLRQHAFSDFPDSAAPALPERILGATRGGGPPSPCSGRGLTRWWGLGARLPTLCYAPRPAGCGDPRYPIPCWFQLGPGPQGGALLVSEWGNEFLERGCWGS